MKRIYYIMVLVVLVVLVVLTSCHQDEEIVNPENGWNYLEGVTYTRDTPFCWTWTEEWKYSELYQLKNEIMAYVVPIVEHQRKLEKQIMNCTTQEELKLIDISFTEELIK